MSDSTITVLLESCTHALAQIESMGLGCAFRAEQIEAAKVRMDEVYGTDLGRTVALATAHGANGDVVTALDTRTLSRWSAPPTSTESPTRNGEHIMNELEARLSPNPIFTALLQEDPAESAARQLFGQLEAGHALGHLMAPGIVHDPKPPAGDPFPHGASLAARMYEQGIVDAPPAIPPSLVAAAREQHQGVRVLAGLISATPTGSINLRLRKQIDQ